MKNSKKTYMVSQGGGQYFEINGDLVKIVSTYEFNPSIERTRYNPHLQEALHCSPCTKEDFDTAEQIAMKELGLPVQGLIPSTPVLN